MYSITFQTKRGGSGIETTTDINRIKKVLIRQFKNKCEATAYCGDEIIGRCYEDNSTRCGWNWFLNEQVGS